MSRIPDAARCVMTAIGEVAHRAINPEIDALVVDGKTGKRRIDNCADRGGTIKVHELLHTFASRLASGAPRRVLLKRRRDRAMSS